MDLRIYQRHRIYQANYNLFLIYQNVERAFYKKKMNFIFCLHITKGSEGKIQGEKRNFLFFCTKNTPMTSKLKS